MNESWLDKLTDWGWQAFMALCAVVAGWVWRQERKIAGNEKAIAALQLHLSENYVKKSEVTELKKEMNTRFDRLEDIILENGRSR